MELYINLSIVKALHNKHANSQKRLIIVQSLSQKKVQQKVFIEEYYYNSPLYKKRKK